MQQNIKLICKFKNNLINLFTIFILAEFLGERKAESGFILTLRT